MRELALIEQQDEPARVLDMPLEYYFPREVVDALSQAGFDPVDVQGSFGGRPFDPVASDIVVYEAVKPHHACAASTCGAHARLR